MARVAVGGILTHGNYPNKDQVKRARVIFRGDEPYCLGFTFSFTRRYQWTPKYNVMTGMYNTLLEGSTFAQINQSYRYKGHTNSPHFDAWVNLNSDIKWSEVFRAIYHIRVPAGLKDLLWRIPSGKVFTGDPAYRYLEHIPYIKLNKMHVADVRKNCIIHKYVHNLEVEATITHIFWECSAVRPLWDLVDTYLNNLQS